MTKTNNVGSQLKAEPIKKVEIDVDTSNGLARSLVAMAESSTLDTSALENFSTVAQSREQIYELLDVMASDSDIAAILEAYVDEVCEPNENGDIIWVESEDQDIQKFIKFILDSMNVNKHARSWANLLVKYGDVYFKLFKESELKDELFDTDNTDKLNKYNTKLLTEGNNMAAQTYNAACEAADTVFIADEEAAGKTKLIEDVIVKQPDPKSHFSYYIEAERNPAEMFELVKQGKTAGFIKAPVNVLSVNNDKASSYFYNYHVNKKDINLYNPMQYVHAYMEDTSSRVPEEVTISTDTDKNKNANYTYSVRRGQSLLYNSYKVWRELKLLETAVLLNRITKSSVIRFVEVEVGNLPDTEIRGVLADIKSMVEQKSALNVGNSMTEYTMPGPVENTVYLPTRGEIGKISIQELGASDVDPKSLLDLDYFNNKLYGSTRVPKAYFNFTDDGAGFNGGESLAIISNGFGKKVKRFQNVLCLGIKDIINIILLDRGMDGYINRFTIKMNTPLTKEEQDRRDAAANEVNLVRDLMGVIRDDVEDPIARLELLKVLVKNSPQSLSIIEILDKEIKKLEANGVSGSQETDEESAEESAEPTTARSLSSTGLGQEESELSVEEPAEESGEQEESENDYLPTFDELGVEDATISQENA